MLCDPPRSEVLPADRRSPACKSNKLMKKSKKLPEKTKTGIDIIKVGTAATDRATGISGEITHVTVDLERNLKYHIQPRKISTITMHPLPGVWVSPNRIDPAQLPVRMVRVELPLDLLGTFVRATHCGMTGMVVGIQLHPLGCVHVLIQPAGTGLEGFAIDLYECDYRSLENAPELPAAENPSPEVVPSVPAIC